MQVLKTKENTYGRVFSIFNALKEKYIWIKINTFPILNNSKEISMVYSVFEDITESRQIQQELLNQKKKAEEANQAKNIFLTNMSHELRTPLNGIIGFSDLLTKTELNLEQKDYLLSINHSANILFDLVNDILAFSNIESGQVHLSIDKCDLNIIFDQLIDIVSHKSNEKRLDTYFNLSPHLPRYVWMDCLRFKQIMLNLIGNAIKFTYKGNVHVDVNCIKENDNEVQITFSILDTGIGILDNYKEKLFDAFTQQDSSITRKHGGTGLGLPIANHLIKLMGGKLDFKTQKDVGTSFFFTLKLRAEYEPEDKYINSSKIKNVLLVDRVKENKTIISNILYNLNVKMDFIEDDNEKLNNIDFKNYNLIIIEHNLLNIDSIELIKHIRNNLKITEKDLKIMFLYNPMDIDFINENLKGIDIIRTFKPLKASQFRFFYDIDKEHSEENSVLDDLELKILIVEDNPINILLTRKIIENILPKSKIYNAINGIEAVKMFNDINPDFIFMDLQMPEMSGFEATRIIRQKDNKNIPIIALTADVVEGTKEICLESGMNDYITKPVTLETIKNSLIKWSYKK